MDELMQLRNDTGADACVACGKCTALCPLAGEGDFSARRLIRHDPWEELALENKGLSRCLTCASCEERCPQGVSFVEYIRGLRAMLPDGHREPCPHGALFQQTAALTHGQTPKRKAAWLTDDLQVAEEGEVAMFVGCLPLFDLMFADSLEVNMTGIAREAIRLLNHVGITPVLLSDERCCGHDELWSGQQEAFEELARANLASFQERGIKKVVTACAECARTWKLDYPEVDASYQPEVVHIAELLAGSEDLAKNPRLKGRSRVSLQDPCRLSRHLDAAEAPRKVLEALPGVELKEMERHGRDTDCCGTSGFVHCDSLSKQLQRKRLDQARQTGAAKLLTACPKCLIHFACSQAEDRRRGRPQKEIELEDFTVYIANRLLKAGKPKSPPPLLEVEQQIGETR